MSRQKQRHYFVAQLLVIHLAAVFVAGRQQHRKQVAFILSAGPPFGDDSVDNIVNSFGKLMKAQMRRRRQPVIQNPFQSCLRREGFDQFFQRVTHVIDVV